MIDVLHLHSTPSRPPVEPDHAKLTQKGKQLFLTAVVGESVFDASRTWIDGDEARPNVAYVLQAGSTVAFGAEPGRADAAFKVGPRCPMRCSAPRCMALHPHAAG